MMGRLNHDQGQLFYSFCLDEVVPSDHRVRDIAAVLDLSWVQGELAPYYSNLGRPSIDPVLMIRMLILGYVFAIRSTFDPGRGVGQGARSRGLRVGGEPQLGGQRQKDRSAYSCHRQIQAR